MALSKEQQQALYNFFDAVQQLKVQGIIKSDQFLGDIGEFMASNAYDLVLAKSRRQPGHDTQGDTNRVQIKFQGSPTKTNVDFGNPDQYDEVVAVIGPNSLLHPGGKYTGQMVLYRFSAEFVKKNFKQKKPNSYSCGKKGLGKPDGFLSLTSDSGDL